MKTDNVLMQQSFAFSLLIYISNLLAHETLEADAIKRNPKVIAALQNVRGQIGDALLFLGGDMAKRSDELDMLTTPGDTILETLYERNIRLSDFAKSMEMDFVILHQLLSGELTITPVIAKRLEIALGIEALFWLNREALYRDKLAGRIPEVAPEEEI